MQIEELRDGIWEYLFQAKASKSIDELASLSGDDESVVRGAVDHEWFLVSGDQVSIAYSNPGSAK